MSTVIKVEGIGKQYRLGVVSTGTLSHDLNRFWHRVRGKEDPYLKIGEANDRMLKGQGDLVWALKDVNFEVKEGEVLGIVGKNGAGKSTLLKILAQVTTPTVGQVKVKGRIASLLEVGTGFHQELTGRENVFLNGAILGMTKSEVKSKFDEIVEFSGIGNYIDTPVKRYSSGMMVRLGFAVAAHLEPEILIVDEVLAVGDAEFQKKCLGKMKDVSGQGRTVLFVSHNMAAVKSLCDNAIVLENGTVKFNGEVISAVSYYLKGNSESLHKKVFGKEYEKELFTLHEISLHPKGGSPNDALDEYHEVELVTKLTIKEQSERLHLTYVLNNENGEALFTFSHIQLKKPLHNGLNVITCSLPKGFLNIGSYYMSLYIIQDKRTAAFIEKDIISFDIQEGERPLGTWMGKEPGFIKPVFDWKIN